MLDNELVKSYYKSYCTRDLDLDRNSILVQSTLEDFDWIINRVNNNLDYCKPEGLDIFNTLKEKYNYSDLFTMKNTIKFPPYDLKDPRSNTELHERYWTYEVQCGQLLYPILRNKYLELKTKEGEESSDSESYQKRIKRVYENKKKN